MEIPVLVSSHIYIYICIVPMYIPGGKHYNLYKSTEIFDYQAQSWAYSNDIAFLNDAGTDSTGIMDTCIVKLSTEELVVTGGKQS